MMYGLNTCLQITRISDKIYRYKMYNTHICTYEYSYTYTGFEGTLEPYMVISENFI